MKGKSIMITIKQGKNIFTGELQNFDAGSEILIYKFKDNTELHFTNPPRRLITMLLQLGLSVIRDSYIDYDKGVISLDRRESGTVEASKQKQTVGGSSSSNTVTVSQIELDIE